MDTLYGHARGFIYLPGEPAIPYDTLMATQYMAAALYCDSMGWGVYRVPPITYDNSLRLQEFYYGEEGEIISGIRLGRGKLGVLEMRNPLGLNFPLPIRPQPHPSEPIELLGYFFPSPKRHGRGVNVNGNAWVRPPTVSVYSLGEESRDRFGKWYSFDLYPSNWRFFAGLPQAADFTWQQIMQFYLPKQLNMFPLDKKVDEHYHKRGESLRLAWEGDPSRSHDSIIISVSTFNNTFPKEFGFAFGERTTDGKVELGKVNVNNPATAQFPRGPRPFSLVPSMRGREVNRLWNIYVATPEPHIEWNMTVMEQNGMNVAEIPSWVFDQFPTNHLIEIRAYRWYNKVEYYPIESWPIVSKDIAKVRAHTRVVTFSYGGLYLQE
jgi:hypothetical protein